MQFKLSLLDDEDLKRIETTMVHALVRAFRIIHREGLLQTQARAEPAPAPAPAAQPTAPLPTSGWPVAPVYQPEPTAQPSPAAGPEAQPEPEDEAVAEQVETAEQPTSQPAHETRVPVFLKPPPPQPFPNGRAVEPAPKQKSFKKTGPLYQKLYPTMKEKPQGTYLTQTEAAELLGDPSKFSGPISTWLQNKQLEAVIVTDIKPPTKGLPGRLLIRKESLIARDQQRQTSNRGRAASK